MHKLGENLQQKYGNQSQRLQLFAEPVAEPVALSYLHIYWIFYNAHHHHHHPKNRHSHHHNIHRSHRHLHLDCRPHHHTFAWKNLF